MKNANCYGICDGEFVERFDELRQLNAERNHFWIKNCAEYFLNLRQTCHENHVRIVQNLLKTILNEVNRISRQHDGNF